MLFRVYNVLNNESFYDVLIDLNRGFDWHEYLISKHVFKCSKQCEFLKRLEISFLSFPV